MFSPLFTAILSSNLIYTVKLTYHGTFLHWWNFSQFIFHSLYEDTSVPLLTSPEADKWPGEAIFPDFNYNQDSLVPELFLLENIDDLPEKYDDVEPEDELLSFLEEIIMEDEKKTEGSKKYVLVSKRA